MMPADAAAEMLGPLEPRAGRPVILTPTNPKDAVGFKKIPMHLWPEVASALGALALLDGALKYGRSNWRDAGVRATIYVDAIRRHLAAWLEGEDLDPDSGLPQLAHVLACAAILVDAQAHDKLVDDRNYRPTGIPYWRDFIDQMTPAVAQLQATHAARDPKHFTQQEMAR